jgi:hypothetical protein
VYFLHFLPKFEIGHSFQFQNYIIVVFFFRHSGKKSLLQLWKDIKGSSISFLDYRCKVFHPLFHVSLAHPVLLHMFSLFLPVQLL